MYQGKFAKNNTSSRKPATPAPETPKAPVSVAENPRAPSPAPVPREAAPAPKPEVKAEAPRRTMQDRSAQRRQKEEAAKRKRGTAVFYSIYLICVLLVFVVIACVMEPLREWLVQYEASQPANARDQVFSQYFETPDWKTIYNKAGIRDSKFENADTFAAYMTQKVGTTKLNCLETSAGLSGDKKFIVKAGEEKLATFTLVNAAAEDAQIAQWELGKMEVFFTAKEAVTVQKLPEHTVYINGVALDESYTVRSVTTLAENYLPEGIHGYRLVTQQVTGLLNPPQVSVKDADGKEVPVTQDPSTGVYSLSFDPHTATEDEKTLALNATKVYAEYMIGKSKLGDIQKLFDTNSQFYETIRRSEVGWAQSGASYKFTDPVYSEFYRYSDTLFSIRLEMALEQTRFDGSVKTYPLNNTLFFEQNQNGVWKVMEATNVAVQEQKTQVRLTFRNNGQVFQTSLVDADAASLTLPQVAAPEGKVFLGWVTEGVDEGGKPVLTMVFSAADGETVYLPSDNLLEPMVLDAYFEEAK